MKNLFLLGTLSFSIAFSLGIVVDKNVTKSAVIGGIATISTLGSALVLSKKTELELKQLRSHTENLKSIENQILDRKNQNQKLVRVIDSKTKLKITIEAEYNSILLKIEQLKEEINSLNTQRDNLETVIVDLKSQERQILQLLNDQNQSGITIEKESIPVLGKIKEPKYKIIKKSRNLQEINTLYAQNLLFISKDIWSIYEYNIETFRSQIPRNNWGDYWAKLAHGFNILAEENTLLAYFAFYGGSHYYKLLYLLDKLFSDLTQSQTYLNIEIIDYGCGQALGTTCLLDYLRKKNLSGIKIDQITLIEPSKIALSRGILHINHLRLDSDNLEIRSIDKQLQYLNIDDLSTSNTTIKLHIFSNILDVTGFEINNLANTIKKSQSGINYFLCVSPTDLKNRIQQFFKFWNQNGYHTEDIQLSSEDLYQETWRFKSDQFQRDKIHRSQKLFYVIL
ncbi:hypothetical protein QUB68_03010 [Microcoleus sp. A006_D1]|uniref:hypothetical protein n=1 Tax=Microcoleus sp. A006_D1 TaxID=3055267 RepID=UPI002FD692A4